VVNIPVTLFWRRVDFNSSLLTFGVWVVLDSVLGVMRLSRQGERGGGDYNGFLSMSSIKWCLECV
jgi:hypothetical protein